MRPASTYRLQIRSSFDLDAAADVTGYLHDLGADWAYLSPLLKAAAGSDHGYDVVDPSLVDPARGGAAGLDRFAAAARAAGLGILIDIVPNHMGVAVAADNPWWWDVLTYGRESRYAEAFDIDWAFGGGRIRLPVLGDELDEVIAAGDLVVSVAERAKRDEAPEPAHSPGVIRYFDHAWPLAPGSLEGLEPTDIRAVLERQHWEPLYWRRESAELNYRRFFAVTTLAGVRVEVPWVFDQTHAEILRWVREGLADGLRVDHPDGLLDPGGYLERLADATGDTYVLVEKILEFSATDHPEALPGWWDTDGTTGYDAMAEFDRVFVDPAGEAALDALDVQLLEAAGLGSSSWEDVIHTTKRNVADTIQLAEVKRLVRELPRDVPDAEDAVAELLACFPVYRSYLPVGVDRLEQAAVEASRRRPDLTPAVELLVPMLADPTLEVARRFQQTTGPVMAKGVEDTAFYRYNRLGTLTEVGGDPSVFALSVEGFHAAQQRRQAAWPHAMTALTTHDTKRGEDVRSRLAVLSEMPERWGQVLAGLRSAASTGHGPFDDLLYQAIIGSWPATADRLHDYAEKAAREAAEKTGWLDPQADFEKRVHALVDSAVASADVAAFADAVAPFGWSNSLSTKLVQLTAPGVPDVYQGSERWQLSLVDPDNRRPVDFAVNARMLSEVDAVLGAGAGAGAGAGGGGAGGGGGVGAGGAGDGMPAVDASGRAKLLVTSRALRLRRDRPELFTRYRPATVVGEASGHALAFDRGGAVTVATRLPVGLGSRGGWGDSVLLQPAGRTVDVLTGRTFDGGEIPLADLLATYPVALLVPAP